MWNNKDIETLILKSVHITPETVNLIKSVCDLKKSDSNIKDVNLSWNASKFSKMPYVLVDVKLEKPFSDVSQLKSYLELNGFNLQGCSIVETNREPLVAGFERGIFYTPENPASNSFYVRFS